MTEEPNGMSKRPNTRQPSAQASATLRDFVNGPQKRLRSGQAPKVGYQQESLMRDLQDSGIIAHNKGLRNGYSLTPMGWRYVWSWRVEIGLGAGWSRKPIERLADYDRIRAERERFAAAMLDEARQAHQAAIPAHIAKRNAQL